MKFEAINVIYQNLTFKTSIINQITKNLNECGLLSIYNNIENYIETLNETHVGGSAMEWVG